LLPTTPFLWTSSPAIADNLNYTGWENYEKGRLYSAEFYYRLALIFDSKMPEYQYNLGLVYEDQKKFDQARAAYEIAVQKHFGKAYNNLARLDILDKKYTQAVSLLQKSLSLVEDDDKETKYTILKNLGWVQMELGHYQEAQTNLQEAINLFNNKSPAFCLKAQILQRQGNQQASVSDWKNCMKYANPQNPDERLFKDIAPPNLK
jgi:tetratricopeptide (TPR) repeat protein